MTLSELTQAIAGARERDLELWGLGMALSPSETLEAQNDRRALLSALDEQQARIDAMEKDAPAMRAYYFTCYSQGFIGNSPLWHELAEETRKLYREHVAARAQTKGDAP